MVTGKPRSGNIILILSISKEADALLRSHSPRYGDKSYIVNNLILNATWTPQNTPQPADPEATSNA